MLQFFLVFLKCTLEKGLGCFQHKIITCDNAGENIVLEKESGKNDLWIIFEYTAPGTPQQNGVVERAFVTVMG